MGVGNMGSCCATCCAHKFDKQIDLDELYEMAQTGDVILFNEKGGQCFQQCFARSPWVHVGFVVEVGQVASISGKYFLEACMPKVTLSPLKRGIRSWLHESRVEQLALRQLNNVDRTPEILEKVENLAINLQGAPYEDHFADIVDAVIMQDADGCWGCCKCDCCSGKAVDENEEKEKLKALFCSELVAHMLQEAGWLNKKWEAGHYLPKDFGAGDNGLAHKEMSYNAAGVKGTFGPEIQILEQHPPEDWKRRVRKGNQKRKTVHRILKSCRNAKS